MWDAGEAEEDGYEDEYQLEDIEIGAANYIKAVAVSNFRKAWEDTDPASEISDDYGLGVRDSLQVSHSHSLPTKCALESPSCQPSLHFWAMISTQVIRIPGIT